MKEIILILCAGFLLSCGGDSEGEDQNSSDSTATEKVEAEENVEKEKTKKPKSPRLLSEGTSDGVSISIDFGSPYVKGRTIWGDLVPYGEVWRAGANEATAVTFESDVMFADAEVSAGTYALFIVPIAEGDWQVILNEEWSKEEHGVWGAYDHNPEKDVAKIDIAPDWRQEAEESLRFTVVEEGIEFAWENVAFTIGISANN